MAAMKAVNSLSLQSIPVSGGVWSGAGARSVGLLEVLISASGYPELTEGCLARSIFGQGNLEGC
jgi:hypothetical protein